MEDQSLASYVGKIMSTKDYPRWFSDRLSQKYVRAFPLRYSLAVCKEQQEDIFREASAILTLYSILVYYIYPNDARLKNEINANKEFSSNFRQVKEWLEANEGKKAADDYMEKIMAQNTG